MVYQLIDYQIIVDWIGVVIAHALPIGIFFGIADKLVTMFLSMAFGSDKVKLS